MCNRRRGVEKTIAYAECHDQSIVGDKTLGERDLELGTNMTGWKIHHLKFGDVYRKCGFDMI